jgi:predicted secreted protein
MALQDTIEYGGDLMVFVSSGATKLPLAFSSSAKLSINTKTRDTGSKDSGNWDEFLAGKSGWNASTDGLMAFYSGVTNSGSSTIDVLYAYQIARTPVNFVFAHKTGSTPGWTVDATKKSFSGMVLITGLDLNAADGDNATYSCSLQGTGALTLA